MLDSWLEDDIGDPPRTAEHERPAPPPAATSGRRGAKPVAFHAELDACELDERGRPGRPWAARAVSLSTSTISFASRRMCYPGRIVVLLLHLVDDRPVPLLGKVAVCDYQTEGRYRVDVDLMPLPENGPVRDWVAQHCRQGG